MSKHSHISAIFDNAFQSRAGSPDVFMSMITLFAMDAAKNWEDALHTRLVRYFFVYFL